MQSLTCLILDLALPDEGLGLREASGAITFVEPHDDVTALQGGAAFGADVFDPSVGFSGEVDNPGWRRFTVDHDCPHHLLGGLRPHPHGVPLGTRRGRWLNGANGLGLILSEQTGGQPQHDDDDDAARQQPGLVAIQFRRFHCLQILYPVADLAVNAAVSK